MFHSYRSGKQPISDKAWRKLEAAEQRAGMGIAPSANAESLGKANESEDSSAWKDATDLAREGSWQPLAEVLMRRLPIDTLFATAEEILASQAPGAVKQVIAILKILRERVPQEVPPNHIP